MIPTQKHVCKLVMFFFRYYDDHRDLPSFPTRRSSDLATMIPRRAFLGWLAGALCLPSNAQRLTPNAQHRSEEHTSELQSRQYLVCRLLLEKKKRCAILWAER